MHVLYILISIFFSLIVPSDNDLDVLIFGYKSKQDNKFSLYSSEIQEKISIKYSLNNSLSYENELLIYIIKALNNTGFLNCFEECKEKKEDILFELLFIQEEEFFTWKLYNKNLNQFIMGKKYNTKKISDRLVRKIAKDIWISLFGNQEITPLDQQLIYIQQENIKNKEIQHKKNEKKRAFYKIVINSIFTNFYKKDILKTNAVLIDLGVLNGSCPSVWYSEITNRNVRIVKLHSDGTLSPLIDMSGTAGSLSTKDENHSEVFYISSGDVYKYYFDNSKKQIKSKLILRGGDDVYANLAMARDNSFFVTYKGIIYHCFYDEEYNIFKKEKIQYQNTYSIAPSYNKLNHIIVFTAKINKIMQLILYDISTKEYIKLTTSSIKKADPSVSVCGNYVAYVVHENHKKYIEIMNIFTHSIQRIEGENQDILYPSWIVCL